MSSAPANEDVAVTDAVGGQTYASAHADVDENNPGCH